ncbi:MAG: DeoR/GlpR family DNA-binding transcription regulator [Bacteroidota bacterium]
MKTRIRQNKILDIVRAMQVEIHVEELSEILKVSPLTIRRDLKELALQKAIIRTHGGCLLAGRVALESEYHKKVATNFDLKQRIGKRAAATIKPGEVILVDEGTTAFHLATSLGNIHPLMVYSNSLILVSELSRYPDITMHILGGVINQESYSVSGSMTEESLENIHFDRVFVGVDGVDENGKCFVKRASTARLTQFMLRSGKEKILLADHTKVKHDTGFSYGNLEDFNQWITTPGIDKKRLEKYKRLTNVIY